jgi:protein gp37
VGAATAISWTDATFNPWWGCERVSPGCQNCYAETFAKRTGNLVWGKKADRRRFGDKHWNEPIKWERQAEAAGVQRRVFCASMADVFEYRADHHHDRQRLWRLIEVTPHLTWQLLTKRPENVRDMVPVRWLLGEWPSNVWIGTTVEDQERAELRVPVLQEIPAPVRFLSCEPLIGPVDLRPWLRRISPEAEAQSEFQWDTSKRIGWVIVGGESGPKHRTLDLDHARTIRDECALGDVPFFFKQVGGQFPTSGGDLLDGRQHKAFPGSPSQVDVETKGDRL